MFYKIRLLEKMAKARPDIDYDAMTITDLKAFGRDNGIEGLSITPKANLIAHIQNHINGKMDEISIVDPVNPGKFITMTDYWRPKLTYAKLKPGSPTPDATLPRKGTPQIGLSSGLPAIVTITSSVPKPYDRRDALLVAIRGLQEASEMSKKCGDNEAVDFFEAYIVDIKEYME